MDYFPDSAGFTPLETAGSPGKAHQPGKSMAGFTIIELLIATAVFSVVLLLCTTAMLQIGRVYYKGITTTQTQEVARQVMDDIARNIQFNGGSIVLPGGSNPDRLCVGGKRYSFNRGPQVLEDSAIPTLGFFVLVVDDITGACPASPQLYGSPLTPTSRELLSPKMRLAKFNVSSLGGGLYALGVRVVYGDDDLLADTDGDGVLDNCKNQQAGTQFCAASELNTVVKKRVQ